MFRTNNLAKFAFNEHKLRLSTRSNINYDVQSVWVAAKKPAASFMALAKSELGYRKKVKKAVI